MHELVLAKISLDKGKKSDKSFVTDFTLPSIDISKDPKDDFKDFIKDIKKHGNKDQKKIMLMKLVLILKKLRN